MSAIGGGVSGAEGADDNRTPKANVADLMKHLNLTSEEEKVLEFSDGEVGDDDEIVEWALIGKILSPSKMHPSTIHQQCRSRGGTPMD
jgi:hypothetical protein